MKRDLVECLECRKEEIIKELSKKNFKYFDDYLSTREYLKGSTDRHYRRDFCRYYAMNGPTGLTDRQKEGFFDLLLLGETRLPVILMKLYDIPDNKGTQKLFLSFGTKLIHTVDDRQPIYDKHIASFIKLPNQRNNGDIEEKRKNRVEIYDQLKKSFEVLLAEPRIINHLSNLRRELRRLSEIAKFHWEDNNISDMKILDSSIWSFYLVQNNLKYSLEPD